MTISGALDTYLLADAGVSALLVDRLFPERVVTAKATPDVPFAVYHIEERRAEESTDSLVDLMEVRFDCTAVSDDYDAAFELAHAIRKALEFFKGVMGGTGGLQIEMSILDDIIGGYIPDFGLYTANAKFSLQYVPQ